LLHVKIVQLFLHFAQLVLNFTHLRQDFILPFSWNYLQNSPALSQCRAMTAYCFCEPSYPKLARLGHPTVSQKMKTVGMIADGVDPGSSIGDKSPISLIESQTGEEKAQPCAIAWFQH